MQGLLAASFTPFHPDGRLHLDAIEAHAERLVRDGVQGVFVCGTTGEFASLTVEERKQVAARWTDVAGDQLHTIIHVGHTCLAASQELARHAAETRAHAIAAIGPYFFRPSALEQLVAFTAAIAGEARSLPFYYYHLPQLSGVSVSILSYLRMAADRIPNLRGVKFSDPNLEEYGRCLDEFGEHYDLPFGSDQVLLSAVAMGATSAIGSTYCFLAPLYETLMRAFLEGDVERATHLQRRSLEFVSIFMRHGVLESMKCAMSLIGVEVGPVRLPLRQLDEQEIAALHSELQEAGFFEAVERTAQQ